MFEKYLPHTMDASVDAATRELFATHSNTLKYAATHCNTLQYCFTNMCIDAIDASLDMATRGWAGAHGEEEIDLRQVLATHCNTLQHAATRCNTLQHTAALFHRICGYVYVLRNVVCNTTQHDTTQHNTTQHNTLQHTATTHCNTGSHNKSKRVCAAAGFWEGVHRRTLSESNPRQQGDRYAFSKKKYSSSACVCMLIII